jgi:hypothetical protein
MNEFLFCRLSGHEFLTSLWWEPGQPSRSVVIGGFIRWGCA